MTPSSSDARSWGCPVKFKWFVAAYIVVWRTVIRDVKPAARKLELALKTTISSVSARVTRNGVIPITWISPSIPLSFDTLPYSKDVGLRGGRQLLELTLLISCDPCGRVAHVGPVPVSAPGHGVIVQEGGVRFLPQIRDYDAAHLWVVIRDSVADAGEHPGVELMTTGGSKGRVEAAFRSEVAVLRETLGVVVEIKYVPVWQGLAGSITIVRQIRQA